MSIVKKTLHPFQSTRQALGTSVTGGRIRDVNIQHDIIKSQNYVMDCVGRDLKYHLVPSPMLWTQ